MTWNTSTRSRRLATSTDRAPGRAYQSLQPLAREEPLELLPLGVLEQVLVLEPPVRVGLHWIELERAAQVGAELHDPGEALVERGHRHVEVGVADVEPHERPQERL